MTAIYRLRKSVDLWRWLCPACLKVLQAEGWTVVEKKPAPHPLRCDGTKCNETGG